MITPFTSDMPILNGSDKQTLIVKRGEIPPLLTLQQDILKSNNFDIKIIRKIKNDNTFIFNYYIVLRTNTQFISPYYDVISFQKKIQTAIDSKR